MHRIKPINCSGIKRTSVIQNRIQLFGCYCHVFQNPKNIHKLQTDKFYILLFYNTNDIFLCVMRHSLFSFPYEIRQQSSATG